METPKEEEEQVQQDVHRGPTVQPPLLLFPSASHTHPLRGQVEFDADVFNNF
jgi:hypothetical protein